MTGTNRYRICKLDNGLPDAKDCEFFPGFKIDTPAKVSLMDRQVPCAKKTRPDTRHQRRGRLGRGNNANDARNSEMLRTNGPIDTAGCRVACPRLKEKKKNEEKE